MKNFLVLSILCCYSVVYSQQSYNYPIDSLPSISISGTSTLHGWTVTAGEVTDFPSNLTLSLEETQTIDSFSFSVAVMSLDGGRGASTNGKIQTALQATTSPTITYSQSQPAALVKQADQWTLSSTGTLAMAGKEKAITVDVQLEEQDGTLVFKGSKDLKMSDFEMTPPSAMFGQIQTHDDITVHFEFRYLVSSN